MTPIKAVLFDWGETLVRIPGMIHSPERHVACLERLFEEHDGKNGAPGLRDLGLTWPTLRTAYLEACRKHMTHSATTRREHRFEDRFATTLKLLKIEELPEAAVLSRWVDRFGELIAQDAEMVDGADEVIEELARHTRLAIVSNYPHAPVVYATLKRLELLCHFSTIVVSSELGWLKPHPELYRTALARVGAREEEALFVGDDLDNDIRAPKALGLRTAWFTTEPSTQPPEADITLSDLRQLIAWCNLQSEGRRESVSGDRA
jgi:HAD superfamily hydrolase (TIGR01549 family)